MSLITKADALFERSVIEHEGNGKVGAPDSWAFGGRCRWTFEQSPRPAAAADERGLTRVT